MAIAARSANAPVDPLPRELEPVEGGASSEEVFSCSADEPELRAVVVTVTVVPLAEQEPSGIEQLTVSVGVVENPVVLTGIVTVLPAGAGVGGVGTTTVGALPNVAVAVVFAFTANVHTGFVLPAQTPDHAVNVAPVFGTAVNVTEVPGANDEPAGDCMIVPGPIAVVESVNAPLNAAVAATFAVPTVNVQIGSWRPCMAPQSNSRTSRPCSAPPST